MSGYYPYLLCGLPDLSFDSEPENFSYEDIYRQIFELLTPSDRKLAGLFLAFPTHTERIKAFLALEDDDARAEYLIRNELPSYQKNFFSHSLSFLLTGEEDVRVEVSEETEMRLKRLLDESFYKAVISCGNRFVREWFEFDLVLKNTLVAFAARKQQRSPQDEFLYPVKKKLQDGEEPELITWIKENMQSGDFGLKLRLSYAEEMFAALDLPDVFDRERAVDRFRWNMAEEMVRGKDFQIDKVLCYLLKAGILRRWRKMQAEEGRRYLQDVVSDMRKVNLQGDAL
ncbi:MAG: DUF2764 domain-containing protein [Bacteroidales bacterium]|nr:DUF2764 domain-containing protein [Bacteroidales bacterium]MDE7072577.1 DUF2764 domain-containing protein [Bacteroidales bacterium]